MPRGKKRYETPERGEPLSSPLYAVKVNPDGTLDHSVAFDPKYREVCPECKHSKVRNAECQNCKASSDTQTGSSG